MAPSCLISVPLLAAARARMIMRAPLCIFLFFSCAYVRAFVRACVCVFSALSAQCLCFPIIFRVITAGNVRVLLGK